MSQKTISQDFWSDLDLFPESVGVDLPSFEPTDPDSFEKDFEGLELDNLDEGVYFPALSDAPPPIYRGVSTPSSLTSSSGSMDSMDLTEDSTNSEYSSMTHATSSYQSHFDIAFRGVDFSSEAIGVDPKHTSMLTDPAVQVFTDSDTSGFFDSLRTLEFSPHIFDSVQVVKAQSDDGPYRPSVGISPHCFFTATQGASPAFPTDSPVGAVSTAQNYMGPIRKKFACPECGHLSARKHNLKTHMDTHDPNRPKPFVCPDSECGHPFTRRHDLKRHLESMHGDRAT